MHFSKTLITLTSLLATLAQSTQICPLLGQQWPAPSNIANESDFISAARSIDDDLNASALNGTAFNGTSFSIGLFSVTDPDIIYQYHHTDDSVKNSKDGVGQVDSRSVYRVGSISKLLTVYLFLVREGWHKLCAPVTDYLPALQKVNVTTSDLDVVVPHWSEITIGELASHLGGVAGDCELIYTDGLQNMQPDTGQMVNRWIFTTFCLALSLLFHRRTPRLARS